ncbi:MAG: serine/threonine-protein kinase [Polyangiales bacterium]
MSTSLVPGAVFAGDFELLRPIGRGGSGVVWAARQRSTGRVRALKVFAPMSAATRDPARTARSRARFTQEATIGARIQSPHVIEVVAAGVDDDGETPWLAMELLDGEDLAAHLARVGPLSPAALAVLFAQLTAAVGAAHRAGVLPLDLKPENLFLAAPRGPGEPVALKVLDFGIGRMMREMRDAVTVTSAAGSPLWMAPEQSVEQQKVSPATDLWPLGLIAFRALTGRHYWRTGNAAEVSFAAWVLEMMTEALPAASERAAALGVAHLLPPGFDAWFARCVARDPAARFPSVDALFDALRPVLDGTARPAAPAPSAVATPPAPPGTRRRGGILALVALAAIVAVGGAMALRLVGRAPGGLTMTGQAGDLAVRSGAATVFRHTDGNWHARVSFAFENRGAAPVDLRRDSLGVEGMEPATQATTLPESVTVNPGMTATGDVAWWCAGTMPQPRELVVRLLPEGATTPRYTQTYALAFSPTEPAAATAPTTVVYALRVRVTGDALSFVHTDGNRHARVPVAVENPTDAPLRVFPAHFALRLGAATSNLASQPELTTWGDPAVLPARGTVEGTVGFWFQGDPAPGASAATLVFGPAMSPQAQVPVTLAAGASPLR